ncbi:MAG: hypothetical protein HZC22_01425 [Rhodocyclales bacterium]|nr:hypothetical protein [Rhodocyclales bacterium]
MENTPDRLHPLMAVTALAVTVAALATIGVITGVIPERGATATASTGAAAATFATRLAADPFSLGASLYAPRAAVRDCEDCAIIASVRPLAFAARAGNNQQAADRWEIRVRMDDGTTLTVATEAQPSWQIGERVRLVDGAIMSM